MTHRQKLVSWSLILAGAAAAAIPLLLVALWMAGMQNVSAGFGLYRVLMFAFGCAMFARGMELRSSDAWNYFDSWWSSPSDRKTMLWRTGAILGQLALLLLLLRTFEIENPAFWRMIAPLTLGGCAIHHLTPSKHRLSMFLFLSLSAVWIVFGYPNGLWLIGVGLALVGICHLPVSYWLRVALVVIAGVILAAARREMLPVPWSPGVWPILGSIFMFRMIVYLYELREEKVPAGWSQRIAYFFLLPNVVFPLFPVVDYSTYKRTYYDAEAYKIYQRGIEWILRGTVQLILYRIVYEHGLTDQNAVTNGVDVAQFMVSSFLLYVRVSGQFHLIVGMLHLFGFHLPETHKKYFLASSFTDFWRRINIYWKDFMMKVFYYPAHFRLRRLGDRTAMVLATLVVFVMTWLLHSYQWFWLLGSFPITATDSLFWGVLAVFLVVNSLRESRRGRKRALTAHKWTLQTLSVQALKVGGTFAAICFLWSIWMSPTFADWLSLWSVSSVATGNTPTMWPLLFAGTLISGAAAAPASRLLKYLERPVTEPAFGRRVAYTIISIVALVIVAQPAVTSRLGARVGGFIASLRSAEMNTRDMAELQRGYYEDLMGVSRFNSQLWEAYMHRPVEQAWPQLLDVGAARRTGDFRTLELVPGAKINYLGSQFTVNRWGMRDRDYEQLKAPGVRRFAVLGASVEMGWGVADGQTFEEVVENALNRDSDATKFEFLNFASSGNNIAAELMNLDRVFSFQPDVVLVASHEVDPKRIVDRMISSDSSGFRIPIDSLRFVAEQAGLGSVSLPVVRRRLDQQKDEIIGWVYRDLAKRIRERGATPLWVFVPLADRPPDMARVATLTAIARNAGFEIIDLSSAYGAKDLLELQVSKFDTHPNAEGHRMLARHLYQGLRDNPKLLGN